ncbi:hypothetical protein EJB05_12164, partial [Eragrostis curvula]
MPGGRTTHSRFKILIKINDESICNFTKKRQSHGVRMRFLDRYFPWFHIARELRLPMHVYSGPTYGRKSGRSSKLTQNMREQTNPWFAEYLLRIGNGT